MRSIGKIRNARQGETPMFSAGMNTPLRDATDARYAG